MRSRSSHLRSSSACGSNSAGLNGVVPTLQVGLTSNPSLDSSTKQGCLHEPARRRAQSLRFALSAKSRSTARQSRVASANQLDDAGEAPLCFSRALASEALRRYENAPVTRLSAERNLSPTRRRKGRHYGSSARQVHDVADREAPVEQTIEGGARAYSGQNAEPTPRREDQCLVRAPWQLNNRRRRRVLPRRASCLRNRRSSVGHAGLRALGAK